MPSKNIATQAEPCRRCDDARMVDRIIGHNLEDGRRDLIACPKCLGAGSYKSPTVRPSQIVEPACFVPRATPNLDLERYQLKTLAQFEKLGVTR